MRRRGHRVRADYCKYVRPISWPWSCYWPWASSPSRCSDGPGTQQDPTARLEMKARITRWRNSSTSSRTRLPTGHWPTPPSRYRPPA